MNITMKEMNEEIENAKMEVEHVMRIKIIKYIAKGYTTSGIVHLLNTFNLVTGYKHGDGKDVDSDE